MPIFYQNESFNKGAALTMFTLTVFLIMLLLIIFGIPVAIALGIVSIIGLFMIGDINLEVVIQRMYTSSASFPLLAVPFFVLAGEIMTVGGMSKRLVRFISSLVGSFKSGLGAVSILASTFFAALSGSNAATVAAVGSVMIPEMKEKGYKTSYAASTIAAAGVTGSIIPPSVLLILYGVGTGTSIGDLFIAGFLPGVLIAVSLLIVNSILARKMQIVQSDWAGWGEVFRSFISAFWALMMPVIILGGIYQGIFTPTEAAAVAVGYGLFIGMFVYKDLKLRHLKEILLRSVKSTAVIMLVMSTAGLLGWVFTLEQVPQAVSAFLSEVSSSKIVFIFLVNILLLFVGMFMNAAAALPIFTALLFPAAIAFGIDPIVFGIIMTVNLSIGTVTPPVGVDLFVASSISKIPLEKVIRGVWPFLIMLVVDLFIISYYPPISTFLVNVFK